MITHLCDAHNHLQDDRFGGRQSELIAACRAEGIARMVVNGSCEDDWPAVLALARELPDFVTPSFGLHPWYVQSRTAAWQENLLRFLDDRPSAVGEIGLDRWKRDLPYNDQEAVFLWQLRLAAERDLPVSIHCLRAWGRLFDLLSSHPLPARGFLLHSYGGPREMVGPLARLGAYFSLPGAFAHKQKSRQRDAFRAVPEARLLVETDAPDQLLPSENVRCPLNDLTDGKPINHPANLVAVYQFAAELLNMAPARLAEVIRENYHRFFGVIQVG
jgi:TatD DNase family protein